MLSIDNPILDVARALVITSTFVDIPSALPVWGFAWAGLRGEEHGMKIFNTIMATNILAGKIFISKLPIYTLYLVTNALFPAFTALIPGSVCSLPGRLPTSKHSILTRSAFVQ